MSNAVRSVEDQSSWSPEPSRPLDLDVWHAWLAKNRAEEQRSAASRIRIALLVGVLVATALILFLLLSPRPVADVQPAVGSLPGTTIAGGHLWELA